MLEERRSVVSDEKVDELIKHVCEYVHKDYFLASTLSRSVAFHHGKMPQEVRERVEQAFADPNSPIQFVICTSTLLEGVNLPAKNIFVLSDKHGNSSFTKIDRREPRWSCWAPHVRLLSPDPPSGGGYSGAS